MALKINEVSQIYLGIQGENGCREITIDVSDWLVAHPQGSISIWHKRNGDATPSATGAVFDDEAGTVTWTPSEVDTYVSGEGEAEIRLTENNVIKKSRAIRTGVSPAVTGSGEPLGSDWQSYIDEVDRIKSLAVAAKQNAEAAAENAEAFAAGTRDGEPVEEGDPAYENNAAYYSNEAAQAKTDAEAARDDILGMTVVANKLPEGSDPTASYEDGVMTFGLVTGDHAALVSETEKYQQSISGTVVPTGEWLDEKPVLVQGQFLWIQRKRTWNGGQVIYSYEAYYTPSDGDAGITIDPEPTEGSQGVPRSGGTYTMIQTKVSKETGKGLSTNDYTDAEKTKLAGIEAGAQVNPGNATQVTAGLMSATDKINADKVPDIVTEIGDIEEAIAILIDGDEAPANIAAGTFLFIKGHSTLATGGYHATADITSGGTISSSNVAADTSGLINALRNSQNTMRPVPFTIATSDWELDNAVYVAEFETEYITASSIDLHFFDSSLREYAAGDIEGEKSSGGGGYTFTTDALPTGTISGTIIIWDTNDGKIPILIEGTVMPIENGGTDAATLAGAQANLGITDIEDAIAIVIDGDTATTGISEGQYLFIKNHSTLATGGYHATAAIAYGDTVSLSNVAADTDGIANTLAEQMANIDISSNLTKYPTTTSVTDFTGNARKVGKIVTFSCNFKFTGRYATAAVFATGYRPQFTYYLTCAYLKGGYQYPAYAAIQSNGEIFVMLPESISNDSVYISGTFAI